MYKKLLYGIAAITALFHSIGAEAQSKGLPFPKEYKVPDSLTKGNKLICGHTKEYVAKHIIDTSIHTGGSSTSYVLPAFFPASAIVTCGKVKLYFEDQAVGSNEGFDAPLGVGLARRNLMCDVVTYIQSVFDFSAVPTGQYVRILVDTSYTPTYFPAPTGIPYYAKASAFYPSSTTPIITNGFLHSFVTSGIDPVVGDYHALVQVNFDKTAGSPTLNYYVGTGAVGSCMIDLYSTLLHEITHTLGWSSFIENTYMTGASSTSGGKLFTSIDTSVCKTNDPHITPAIFSTLVHYYSSGTISPYTSMFPWINSKQPPYNHPVDRRFGATFSHLDDNLNSFSQRQRVSPGNQQEYVMGPFGIPGVSRRTYTKGEVESLHNILGYPYKSSYSGYTTNSVPWSSKMTSPEYNKVYDVYMLTAYHERLTSDFSITNDSSTSLTINLFSDTSLHDADGDTIRVVPNSIVNFSGCGSGGNNHNSLSVSADGRSITYTPRHNFYGRAQFGIDVTDGKEIGCFQLYTIDVIKGNNVSIPKGTNLVLNGDFEEGTELKRHGTEESINNTPVQKEFLQEGKLGGAILSDCHPYNVYSRLFAFYPGSGAIVTNNYDSCHTSTMFPYSYGSIFYSAPYYSLGGLIHPSPVSGQRYMPIHIGGSIYSLLGDDVKNCNKYILEFDALISAGVDSADVPIRVGLSNKIDFKDFDFNFHSNPKLLYEITPAKTVSIGSTWQHITIPFTYCNDVNSNVLFINPLPAYIYFMIENISLKEDTTLMTVAISDTAFLPCTNTKLTPKIINGTLNACGATKFEYLWTANGTTFSTDSIVYVTPYISTTYVVQVTNGCQIARDTIVLSPTVGAALSLSDTTICYGDSVLLDLSATGTVGTVTYAWTPTTSLSCSTCKTPIAKPVRTTTYSVTVTDSISCTKLFVTVVVNERPVFTVTDDSVCVGNRGIISAITTSGLMNTFEWLSTEVSCDTCDTTPTTALLTTTKFPVIATNFYGCTASDTATVFIRSSPIVKVVPMDTTICKGDSVTLNAIGALTYNWTPPTGIGCLTCSTTKASPITDITYVVRGTDSFGCFANAVVGIKVVPLPNVVALPNDTSICGVGYITLSTSGATTYAWTPSAGVTSPTSATTAAFVSGSTKYIVTGADTNGCIGKDSVDVTVKPKPIVSVTTPFVNLCAPDSVTLSATGATSYVWTPSTGGIACSTCPTTRALPASFPITYTVTASDTNECTNTAIVYASVVSCACSPTSVFGTAATTLTTATLPTTVTSGFYHLTNNLNIKSNTTMTGAKILIERGVTITVDTNAKLTLDNCHLFTCDEDTSKAMWRGIILASTGAGAGGSSGRIEVRNNCLIEDAMFAIDAINLKTPLSGNVIDVSNSTFNRNQVDISMNGYKVSSPAILPISIKSNLFTARKFTRTTMPGYPNTWLSTAILKANMAITDSKPSYYISKTTAFSKMKCKDASIFSVLGVRTTEMGLTSSAGVYQSEVKIGEGAAVDDYNLFDNHAYGFLSYNSNVTLYHNHFINISRRMIPDVSTTAPVENGMAVLMQSNSTTNNRGNILPSAFGNLTNKFHDCFMGIYTENVATLNIQGTKITTGNTAGSVVAGAAYFSEIYAGYGMMLHCDGIQKSNNIFGNTVSNVNVGIVMNLVNPKAGAVSSISNNQLLATNIDIPSAYRGKQYMTKALDIYSSGGVVGTANTMNITNNTISKVFNGISFQGLTNVKCSTTNNAITLWDTLTPVSSGMQYGIQANSNNEATTSGNTVSSFTGALTADRVRGVIAGSNTNLRICGNTTSNIGRGFEFAKGASQTGTRWIDNTMNNGYKGMVLASDIGNQGFTYNWVTMPWTYWGATLNKWAGTWSGAYYQTFTDNTKSSLSKLYVKNITTGTIERPSNNTGIPFADRYNFTGTSIGTIQIAQQESNCLGSILPIKYNPIPKGGLTGVKTLGLLIMADSLGYDATYNVRQWMSQLSLYELGTIDPELRDSSAALDSFMLEAAGSRFAWLTNIEKAINNNDFSTAQNLLNYPVSATGRVVVNGNLIITDYTDANGVVENYTNYYAAYLRFLLGTMTYSDSTTIWSIAHKCPVKDGAVVYKARALQQRLSFDFIVYNDDSCEYNNGSNYRIAPDVSITGGEGSNIYTLYPNPNNGVFSIKQSLVEDKVVDIRIYNAVGIQIAKEKVQFKNGIANFKVQNASAGLYLICLSDGLNNATCLKFNIH